MNRKLTSRFLELIFVGLLMAGCGTATTLTPTATRAASASSAPPSVKLVPSATPTSAPVKPTATVPAPTPVPTLPPLPQTTGSNNCPDTQPSMLMPGRQGRVSTASAATNRVRSEPSTAGAIIGEIPAGEYFDVLAGPECAQGWAWFLVRADKLEGWMAEGSADEYWVQPILTDAQSVRGPNIELPGFEFVLPKAVGSKMRVSNLPYDPETRTPPVSMAQFADYPLPNADAVIYVYPVEDYLYYRPDQREGLEQIRTAINTLLTNPFSQVSLPSITDSLQLDDVTLTQAGAFKTGFGLHAVARLSPTDGSAEPKSYYLFFGYSSDMKYLIFAKLDVNLNFGQHDRASTTTPNLSLLDEIFKLNVPDMCAATVTRTDVENWAKVGSTDTTVTQNYINEFRDKMVIGNGFLSGFNKGDTIPTGVLIATDFGDGESEYYLAFPVKPIAHYRSWGLFEVMGSFVALNANGGWCATIR